MITLGMLQEKMHKLKNWAIEEDSIVKDKLFRNFKEALEFVNKVGEIAEREKHYPSVIISEGNVRMSLTTSEEKGVSEKDFAVAEEIDKI